MTILPILIYPNDILTTAAAEVQSITPEIKTLAADMQETMVAANGVGLAANQIGSLHRIVAMNADYCAEVDGKQTDDFTGLVALINPKITILDDTQHLQKEGCLSVPHVFADLERPRAIQVDYLDVEGNAQSFTAEDGLLCAAIQHEVDHLDGIMFPDLLSNFQRRRAFQKLNKLRPRLKETLPYPIIES